MVQAIDPKNIIPRKFGWVPDLPDFRDFSYDIVKTKEMLKFSPSPIMSYDLRSQCSPVDNQGRYNSCVLNAETALMEFEHKQSTGEVLELSRFFPYYNCREYQGDINSDNGTSNRLGMQMLAKYGTCPEHEWPYDSLKLTKKPPDSCYVSALNNKVIRYYRLNNLTMEDALDCLSQGYPFVFGITVYSGWYSVGSTGILNLPTATEGRLGGHAVLAVGNIAEQERIIARNSYGAGWGIKGYFTIPYSYLINPKLSGDHWTIRRF